MFNIIMKIAVLRYMKHPFVVSGNIQTGEIIIGGKAYRKVIIGIKRGRKDKYGRIHTNVSYKLVMRRYIEAEGKELYLPVVISKEDFNSIVLGQYYEFKYTLNKWGQIQ